jgi:hypothetical protein
MDDKTEASLIESHREQLVDFKKELAAIFWPLGSMTKMNCLLDMMSLKNSNLDAHTE